MRQALFISSGAIVNLDDASSHHRSGDTVIRGLHQAHIMHHAHDVYRARQLTVRKIEDDFDHLFKMEDLESVVIFVQPMGIEIMESLANRLDPQKVVWAFCKDSMSEGRKLAVKFYPGSTTFICASCRGAEISQMVETWLALGKIVIPESRPQALVMA